MIPGLFVVALVMAACQPNGFKVKGVAEGFNDGDTLYFYDEIGKNPTDTLIVKDGKFSIEGGSVDSVRLCSVVASDNSAGAMFFKENGSIDVTISKTKMPKVGGTKANKGWQKMNEIQAEYAPKFEGLENALYLDDIDDAQRQKIADDYKALEEEMLGRFIDVAEDNISNELGYFIVTSMAGSTSLKTDRLKALIEKMPTEYKQRDAVVELLKGVEAAENTAKGKIMPDFSLPTADSVQVNVKELVAQNKVTILDFWASWCGPCCEEMPEVVSLYEKYHDKGLGIVGISLDHEKDKWLDAIKDLNMTWPQLCDMRTWNTPPIEMFQIRAIPYTVVVDNQGTILEKGLRGTALEVFIEGQFK